jgi:hypothetical protein
MRTVCIIRLYIACLHRLTRARAPGFLLRKLSLSLLRCCKQGLLLGLKAGHDPILPCDAHRHQRAALATESEGTRGRTVIASRVAGTSSSGNSGATPRPSSSAAAPLGSASGSSACSDTYAARARVQRLSGGAPAPLPTVFSFHFTSPRVPPAAPPHTRHHTPLRTPPPSG